MNFYKPPLEQQDLTIQQFGKWWAVAVVVNDISIGVDNDDQNILNMKYYEWIADLYISKQYNDTIDLKTSYWP